MSKENSNVMHKVITVVVPVYNVEKYLDRCVESIVNQTYKNLEIILVDDGSPDKCPEMCEVWKEKDPRIKVVHKKNAGLGYARNTGIDHASGEYICFVDSDDYISYDMIEKTYKCAKQFSADIVSYGFCMVNSKGEKTKKYIPSSYKNFYEGNEIQDYVLPNMISNDDFEKSDTDIENEFWMSMCGGLFSMDLINRTNWRSASERDIISEDVYSLLKLFKFVKRIAFIPEAFYFYCANSESLTHTLRMDRYDKIKDFYNRTINECEILNYSDEVKTRLSKPYIDNTLAALKMILKSDLPNKEKKQMFMNIVKDEHFHKVINLLNIKNATIKKKMLCITMKYRLYYLSYLMIKVRI